MSLTPTPETAVPAYAAAALALAGLACLPLASHLHVRWFAVRGITPTPVYAVVMAVITVGGAVLLGPGVLLGDRPLAWLAALPLGVLLAAVVIRADSLIVRALTARMRPPRSRPGPRGGTVAARSYGGVRTRPAGTALTGDASQRRTLGLARVAASYTPTRDDYRVPGGWLIAVAALEELVFRGVLLRLALELSVVWAVAGIVVLTAAFALAHVFFGWVQVAAKVPLAVLTVLATLLTGGLGAAVVGHALFNGYVWRYRRALPSGGAS